MIALLRSIDMPLAEIRQVLTGSGLDERRELFRHHRARLEARLDEVRRLLDAVDALTKEDEVGSSLATGLSTWLHVMPRLPVSDMDRSIEYYEECLGLRRRVADGRRRASRDHQRRNRDLAPRLLER